MLAHSQIFRGLSDYNVNPGVKKRSQTTDRISTAPMAYYVDPKRYKEGAEQARLKAISYFEQVVQLAAETKFAEYAHQILPALRKQQIQNTYKFFCVND